jgi:hypothetical protein
MPDDQLSLIEAGVVDLMTAFDVTGPPVPVEIMLQRPKPGMWKEINLSELSTAFINIRQRYSPRMSVARLLARNVCRSEWGTTRKLETVGGTDDGLRALARAILMPRTMIEALAPASRTPIAMSMRFEVPEDDARQRLKELGYMISDEPQPLP